MSPVSLAAPEFDRTGERDLSLLMVGYQRGEAAPVDELVRRISPSLLRFFAMWDDSGQDAEDLLQECWIRIHKARHTYQPNEPLLPWIFAIARYTRLDGYRKRRKRESKETLMATLPEPPVRGGKHPSIAGGIDDRLLERLPKKQREVILMLKVSDMSLEEVARATSSTVGSIKQKAHRAYATLRRALEKEGR
jgi:RNA polymerase sigma-70 factor (ECF subfamily)